jgi:class 3 adenylate cyclase
MPRELASQTLAFLFTDIEGSTRLWEQHRQPMKEALERHDAILRGRREFERAGGEEYRRRIDGRLRLGCRRRQRLPESSG